MDIDTFKYIFETVYGLSDTLKDHRKDDVMSEREENLRLLLASEFFETHFDECSEMFQELYNPPSWCDYIPDHPEFEEFLRDHVADKAIETFFEDVEAEDGCVIATPKDKAFLDKLTEIETSQDGLTMRGEYQGETYIVECLSYGAETFCVSIVREKDQKQVSSLYN